MCGIWLYISNSSATNWSELYPYFEQLQNRGPDQSTFLTFSHGKQNIAIGFQRLSIVDPSHSGHQPFKKVEEDRTIYFLCNGEIYGYQDFPEWTEAKQEFNTNSDCALLAHLYLKYGLTETLERIKGSEFAFIILEIYNHGTVHLSCARDAHGVRPLYYSIQENKQDLFLSSELKGIPLKERNIDIVDQYPVGCYSNFSLFQDISLPIWRYYSLPTIKQPQESNLENICLQVNQLLTRAVEQRLQADQPIGALLSGGLDSSLVCAIASRYLQRWNYPPLRTFSVGMPNSTDYPWAVQVADFIGSQHQHVEFTAQQFLEAVPQVIKTIESYDTTTVRASTAQYLVSHWISNNTDIKVLLIGDGSDEITGGYLYFHKAPSEEEFDQECRKLTREIHRFDLQRADRCIASAGLEARVPFLDCRFTDCYFSINSQFRKPLKTPKGDKVVEKYLLRLAFQDYLPDNVLWRTKCALSDACSSPENSWHKIRQKHLKDYSNQSEKEFDLKVFQEKYPQAREIIPHYWLPRWTDSQEASARDLDFYNEDNIT